MLKFISKYVKIFALITALMLAIYFFVRIFYFFNVPYTPFDRIFATLLLVAETHLIIQAAGFVIHSLKLSKYHERYKFAPLKKGSYPEVAVIVAAKDEPLDVLMQTFVTLESLDYPNKKVYFLDGSRHPLIREQNFQLARNYKLVYCAPKEGEYSKSKANIINMFLPLVTAKYIAIFDADQNPMPEFLKEVVALAEGGPHIAFVQTPQLYSNLGTSPIAKGAAMQQSIFYESICEAKSSYNAMFCCGTNVLFRTDVLKKVGGFDENSITEDFATSIKIHQLGYRSIYYNHVRVFGMAPESLPAYFKQQTRWASGTIGVFRVLVREFFKNPRSLSLEQWWEYLQSSTYYFVGWAFFFLMLGPIFYMVFNIPSFFMDPWVYVFTFVPYYIMTLTVFYSTMHRRNYGVSEVLYGIILSSISFPVLMVAAVSGLSGRKMNFVVTPKGKSDYVSFWGLLPWTLMVIFNIIAIISGIEKFPSNPWGMAVNIVWCAYHLLIIIFIYRFNSTPEFKDKVFKRIDPLTDGQK